MTLMKAKLTNVSSSASPQPSFDVLFNPDQYVLTRTVQYADLPVPGLQRPLLQFVHGGSEVLDVTFFVDRTDVRPWNENDSVKKHLDNLRAFVTVASELHAPPVCLLTWSDDLAFTGVVTSLKEEVLLFDEAGHALRAKATVQLKAYQAVQQQLDSMRLASPDRTRVRVLREGETLAHIALEAYGSERLWTVIARANGIDRPRFVRPGTPLYIPAM